MQYTASALRDVSFPIYTEQSYKDEKGVWPPYDPNKLPKFWLDPGGPFLNNKSYLIAGLQGPERLLLGLDIACNVNIPPTKHYFPSYVAPESVATRGGAQLNPIYFSSAEDVEWAMGVFSATDKHIKEILDFPIDYKTETRRIYEILVNGLWLNVGQLVASFNSGGIGAPGHWEGSQFIPNPNELVIDQRNPVPFPIRLLTSTEKVISGLLPGTWLVEDDSDQPASQLDRIEAKLDKILSALTLA